MPSLVHRSIALLATGALAACGGGPKPPAMSAQDRMMAQSKDMPPDDAAAFGPLAVGADWATYVKINTTPVRSETHGNRLVDTYVNRVGAAAYLDDQAAIPVGTVLVKTSFDDRGEAGPLFVMEKQAAGSAPERDDWSYAIHWADPPAPWRAKLGGPIYWRSPSPRAGYCVECHENFERGLGNVPKPQRITALPE